ncbi:nuclear transport factor 2 family protein [Plantactinospora soyae]|uniref:Ketosteroid isomerase-like protein n=1 Tax=Plantactinospora soyae TaxID=1544732 RepID=A0A927R166_9ACTN|nr:nuclear transport factor 2 family protein [Plantactinospora soyae]MBE1489403.1 ketosteroid isomerase-like protein [Plantactinospora soyae]
MTDNSSTDTRGTAEAFLQLVTGNDPGRIADVFADTIDWYVPGLVDLPWTGARTRGSDVPEFFRTMGSAFVPGQSRYAVDRIVVEGNDAVIIATATHTFAGSGTRFTTPMIMHLTVDGGKIVRLHLYEDTHLVARAFSG